MKCIKMLLAGSAFSIASAFVISPAAHAQYQPQATVAPGTYAPNTYGPPANYTPEQTASAPAVAVTGPDTPVNKPDPRYPGPALH